VTMTPQKTVVAAMRSGPAMSPLWRNPTIYESEKFKHYVRHNLPVRQVFKLCPLVSRPAARKIACLFLTDTEKRTSKTEQSSAQMTTFTAENYSNDLNRTCLQRAHRGRSHRWSLRYMITPQADMITRFFI